MPFPTERGRRLRRTASLRSLVAESRLSPADFILPLFVVPGREQQVPIPSLPGQFHFSVDKLVPYVQTLVSQGLRAVMLFGIPEHKDPVGSAAYDDEAPVQRAVRALKQQIPELVVVTDVCLCEYTSHGHCGVIADGQVLNDATLELLAKTALSHARAGADMVAPSDMMDGRVQAIRGVLDAEGYDQTLILSYAVKYASAFYGPFREAAGSTPSFGDRRGYQMDPPNVREAIREARADAAEGADLLMVKPGMPYLDVLAAVRAETLLPVAAYQVSGEYAMMHAAAERGWLDLKASALESLVGMKRAGADLILTYFCQSLLQWAPWT